MPRKKKDLTELLMELKKTRQKDDNQQLQTPDNRYITIRDLKIVIEIPQLEELTREVRQLKEAMIEFVRIIKSRLEESEEEQDRTEQNIAQIEEKNEH
ncbi:MAG: hypothetical protein GXO26_00435 [Crenarchaeota archaeon]|nr:hypothetical protein [Thermoproteota archaeon]